MSVQHFKSLLFKSTRIQKEIESENRRPRPDWMRLLKLKKIRLTIKDRMARLVSHEPVLVLETVRIGSGSKKYL